MWEQRPDAFLQGEWNNLASVKVSIKFKMSTIIFV